jgi:hypothetical protein
MNSFRNPALPYIATAGANRATHMAQVENTLVVRVEWALSFTHGMQSHPE